MMQGGLDCHRSLPYEDLYAAILPTTPLLVTLSMPATTCGLHEGSSKMYMSGPSSNVVLLFRHFGVSECPVKQHFVNRTLFNFIPPCT